MSPPIRAVLFDFDGTLVDSEPLHFACWIEAIRPYGGGMDWEDYTRRLTGQTDRRAAEILLGEAGHEPTEELIEEACSAKRAAFNRRFCEELSIPDPVKSWISEAFPYLPLGVVSSSLHPEVKPVLTKEDVHRYLEAVVCGDDVTHHKPHPEPYLRALALLNGTNTGLSPAECLVLEDSVAGVQSATEAGMIVRKVSAPADVRPILDDLIRFGARKL